MDITKTYLASTICRSADNVLWRLSPKGELFTGESCESALRDNAVTENTYRELVGYVNGDQKGNTPRFLQSFIKDRDIYALVYMWEQIWHDKSAGWTPSAWSICDENKIKFLNVFKRENGIWKDVTEKFADLMKASEEQINNP